MCSKNLHAVARTSSTSPSRCKMCSATGLAAWQTSSCPCCKMPGSKNNMVGKSRDWTFARSSSRCNPYHERSDADADTELWCCSGRRYSQVSFLLFPLVSPSAAGEGRQKAVNHTYFEHEEHLGRDLSHFRFRVLHEMHASCAWSRLASLLGVCMSWRGSVKPLWCCTCQYNDGHTQSRWVDALMSEVVIVMVMEWVRPLRWSP